MLSRSLPAVFACVSTLVVVAACSNSDSATPPQQAAGAGGSDAGVDASEASAGSGGVDAAGEAAPDQNTDECTPGEGRCEGKTPQICDQARVWQPCTACAFLDTDPHNCGVGGNDCKGGSCAAGKCSEVVTLAAPGGEAVAVDATSVYWLASEWDEDAGLATRSVMKAGLNGESPVTLWHGSAGRAFAIDATSIYLSIGIFDEDAGGWLAGLIKLGLNGGTAATLATTTWSPAALALDATSVYWTSGNYVAKMPQTGGDPALLADGPWVGTAIAIDADSVYWTDQGNDYTPGTVLKVPLSGGSTVVLAADQPWAHAVTVDETYTYWLTWDGLMKVNKHGGTSEKAAISPNGDKGQVVLDATSIYWTTNGGPGPYPNGTVRKMPLAGGSAQVLASGQESPMGIAVDATSVYWITSNAVMKVAK
jgi:hypothetical protein